MKIRFALLLRSSALLLLLTVTFGPAPAFALPPVAVRVAANADHSLFVKSDGTLWGMGYNVDGELGISSTSAFNPTPQKCANASNVTAVVTGTSHTLFTESGATMWVMGDNTYGELGDGSNLPHFTPEETVFSSAAFIAAGDGFSLYSEFHGSIGGSLWAMGDNIDGQLGDGNTSNTNKPVELFATGFMGGAAVIGITAGNDCSHFIKPGGTVWGMGSNVYGQLGDGTQTERLTPVQTSSLLCKAVVSGSYHTLFIDTSSNLWATGYGTFGQLGVGGGSGVHTSTPLFVTNHVIAAAAGQDHSLFIKDDGSLWGMGWNAYGQLGDGTTNGHFTPIEIVQSNVIAIAAGSGHSLFIKSDGSLWAMGLNGNGQLGDGTFVNTNRPKQILAGLPPAPVILNISTSGTNLVLKCGNGVAGFTYYTLMSTNLTQPLNQWTIYGVLGLTNSGNFTVGLTGAFNSNSPPHFFALEVQ